MLVLYPLVLSSLLFAIGVYVVMARRHAVLVLMGVELMLNTAYEADHRPGTPEPARVAAHKDTGLFFACPDVDGAHVHLRAQGIDIEPPTIAPYGMKQLYLRDPDGYEICLQSRASEPDGHA